MELGNAPVPFRSAMASQLVMAASVAVAGTAILSHMPTAAPQIEQSGGTGIPCMQ
jgi:hypothetical protein